MDQGIRVAHIPPKNGHKKVQHETLQRGGKSHKKVYMIPPTLATISPTNSGMSRPLCQRHHDVTPWVSSLSPW